MKDFYECVAIAVGQIPEGKVATYGQIALLCGKPKNSRQVGYALHQKLEGQSVPAHRVVNGKGYLSGAMAFSFSGEQRILLENEGVKVNLENRVDLKICGWKNTLDEAMQLKEMFQNGQPLL